MLPSLAYRRAYKNIVSINTMIVSTKIIPLRLVEKLDSLNRSPK